MSVDFVHHDSDSVSINVIHHSSHTDQNNQNMNQKINQKTIKIFNINSH